MASRYLRRGLSIFAQSLTTDHHVQGEPLRTQPSPAHVLISNVVNKEMETKLSFFQLVTLALVASASAAGPPAYGAPAPYVEPKLAPQPYAYEYGVADDYSHSNFKKAETQDAGGNVAGSFTIALPDGRIQTTTYTADHTNGFVAEVSYSGEAAYPPAPAGGYPGEANAYAAPAPAYAPGRK